MTDRIGLIAGSGRFPILFAEEAKRIGADVIALGIRGVTDPTLENVVSRINYLKLGQIDKAICFFKEAGVTRAVMAGKVQHNVLYGGVLPDLRAIKLLAGLRDKRTDTILQAVAGEFAKDGIELLPSSTYLSRCLAQKGNMTKRAPTAAESADVHLGWRAAKAVAGFDIGQTVVVQEGAVIAVEAMEGTDAAIRRAADIARSHGQTPALVVVKVAKPRQDWRFDLPVIGLETLKTLEQCHVTTLAVEAGKTLIFDFEEFVRGADKLKIAVAAIEGTEGENA